MSADAMRISRRLLIAGGGAFGLELLRAPALAQTPEKVTYLFPAPPIMPAATFGLRAASRRRG